MNVDPEVLAALALECRAHAENLLAGHPAGAVEPALSGWIGDSRLALAATAHRWGEATAALAARVAAHGDALRAAALAANEMEAGNTRRLFGPS